MGLRTFCVNGGHKLAETAIFEKVGGRIKRKCGVCRSEKAKKNYSKPKVKQNRLNNRRFKQWEEYGITADDFVRLIQAQDNRCAICGDHGGIAARGTNLHLDHDHKTNRIRGLLCGNCNRGLGSFKDCPDILSYAIKYLSFGYIQ